ncbi:unnamed protein product [Rotaria magnacalcarata]
MSATKDNEVLNNDEDHWWSQISMSQLFTPQDPLPAPKPPDEQEQKLSTKQRKKKSRGNRAEQHFRRRLNRRNLDEASKASLIQARMKRQEQNVNKNNIETNQMEDDLQVTEVPLNDIDHDVNSKKRKRNTSTNIQNHLSQSFSQLSISQGCQKKTKNNIQSEAVPLNTVQEKNDQSKALTKSFMSTYLPQYLTVSDRKFKEILSKSIHDGHKIYEWLDTDEKLKLTRQLAHSVNLIYYLKLQQQLWQDYYDLGIKDGVWAPRISKVKAKEHNTCLSYGRSEKFVEQRQKTIQHQLNRTENELQQHLHHLAEWTDKAKPSIDSIFLSTAIERMVKNAQHRLNVEFQHKRIMLKLDVDDHHLITSVYDLETTEEQIELIKIYWQAIADEQKALEEMEVLRKRASLKRLPKSLDNLVDQSADNIQTMLSRSILNKDRRASMASRCSKTITQYKGDLMEIAITIAYDTARGHAQLAFDTKNKLRLLDRNASQSTMELIIKAMEIRAENMKKRAQELLQYKLMSFFELAPVVINDEANVSTGAI